MSFEEFDPLKTVNMKLIHKNKRKTIITIITVYDMRSDYRTIIGL